ncbi:hypothetical protein AA106556_0740 [Neokomagataea tanensis NBRC 106556]|uniref:Uncharacterized protein n=1 Tax=Neokomagataea tanensis NBRC 106556 TaxID=1223519 RepID=A0ABQ0QHV1_9PROT|nr:hypothetical protein AA106556_0740 [Neokomagataea tanensis NBRC 106556]
MSVLNGATKWGGAVLKAGIHLRSKAFWNVPIPCIRHGNVAAEELNVAQLKCGG